MGVRGASPPSDLVWARREEDRREKKLGSRPSRRPGALQGPGRGMPTRALSSGVCGEWMGGWVWAAGWFGVWGRREKKEV